MEPTEDRPAPVVIRRPFGQAEACLFMAEIAATLWVFLVFARIMRQAVGQGKGFLSTDFSTLEIVLMALWILLMIGGLFLGFDSLKAIRRSDGTRGGKGEALAAIFICAATGILSIVGLITMALVQWLAH